MYDKFKYLPEHRARTLASEISALAQRRARTLFWILGVIITGLALYPRLTLPEPGLTEGVTPYVNHLLAFVTLATIGAIGRGLPWQLILGPALSRGRDRPRAEFLARARDVARRSPRETWTTWRAAARRSVTSAGPDGVSARVSRHAAAMR